MNKDLKGLQDSHTREQSNETREIKRAISRFRKAAKWRSRTGPQCEALVLWEAVERLEKQLLNETYPD